MNWKQLIVSPEKSIIEALRILDAGAKQIVLVARQDGILLGTVTDGDVRRGILRGLSLESPVELIMNPRPFVAKLGESQETILSWMKKLHLR
jgi:CBS domain-containing protein